MLTLVTLGALRVRFRRTMRQRAVTTHEMTAAGWWIMAAAVVDVVIIVAFARWALA